MMFNHPIVNIVAGETEDNAVLAGPLAADVIYTAARLLALHSTANERLKFFMHNQIILNTFIGSGLFNTPLEVESSENWISTTLPQMKICYFAVQNQDTQLIWRFATNCCLPANTLAYF